MPNPEAKDPPVVRNAPLPPGVLPRHAQTWVIVVLAVVMAVIIAFSGSSAPKAKQPNPPQVPVLDPNKARIEEYSRRVEMEAHRLNDEREQLEKVLTAQNATGLADINRSPAPTSYAHSRSVVPPREKSWIETDQEKRGYQSLYASTVALSYRERPANPRRALAGQDLTLSKSLEESPSLNNEQQAGIAGKSSDNINRAVGTKYRLFEGSFLETVLTNRLDGSFSGPVNCMTTTDAYSRNGQHVLIPAGSRVMGEASRVDAFGQQRLAVSFHRLIMPDGYSVNLDKFQGLNQRGETGLRDRINHHYMQVFGVSIAIGAIAGLAQANTQSGIDYSGTDAYRQGVAASLSQSSLRILDRYLNILPTITIQEGHRIKIYLTDDLLLPAYENHRMPDEL